MTLMVDKWWIRKLSQCTCPLEVFQEKGVIHHKRHRMELCRAAQV